MSTLLFDFLRWEVVCEKIFKVRKFGRRRGNESDSHVLHLIFLQGDDKWIKFIVGRHDHHVVIFQRFWPDKILDSKCPKHFDEAAI